MTNIDEVDPEFRTPLAKVDLRPRIQKVLDRDLPRLAAEYPGKYVVYDLNGMICPPADDPVTLEDHCRAAGMLIGEYLISPTQPPPMGEPEYEVEICFP